MDDGRKPRIVGGHPALDLVNTVAPRRPAGPAPTDDEFLASPQDLLSWARRAAIIDAPGAAAVAGAWQESATAAAQALHATVDVREALYTVLISRLAGDPHRSAVPTRPSAPTATPTAPTATPTAPAAAAALERLTLRWAAAAARSSLMPDDRPGHAARLVVGIVPALTIPDRLAHAAVELLCSVDLSRLKTCPLSDGGCGWLFLDLSRNSSRRWCAMVDCGTQAKVRRLTARRRVVRASAVSPNGSSY